jgi:glycine/D-amino acid oxidase-like deaminating enzyme
MPTSADVVVIGGGPTGAAILWALERAAPELRTVLVERNAGLAAGTSVASLENFRTCWPAPCLANLMRRSIDVFLNAEETLGGSIGVKQRGYLFLGFTPAQAGSLRREVDHLHDIGLTHVEYLDADEVRARYPWLAPQVIAAKYDPIAGWLDSNGLVHAFARSAGNATVLLGVKDARITSAGGRVTGVTTSHGAISAPVVVIAAGPGSRAVGRTAGVELPIVMRPRQSFTTPWRHAEFPADAPMLIAAAPFAHVRPEAQNGAIFGYEYYWNTRHVLPDQPVQTYLIDPLEPIEQCKDPRFPSIALTILARQFGHVPGKGFNSPNYLRGVEHHVGYYVSRAPENAYEIDAHGQRHPYDSQRAIMDRWAELDGLFLSVAHGGHGIMSSPGTGEILAALILGRDLPHPSFADFGVDVPFVEYDSGGISAIDKLEF